MDDSSTTSPSPSLSKEYDVILVGDSSVGKSCILRQMCEQKFSDNFTCTMGMDYRYQDIQLEDGQVVKLKIYDTMGEERYAPIMSVYYRGAQAAVLVYDITNDSSFINIPTWLDAIRKFSNDKNILLAVVGNKLDSSDRRNVPTNLGRQYAENNEMMFFETSAKTGENVKELFHDIAQKLVAKPVIIDVSQPLIIVTDSSRQEQSGCCLFSSKSKITSPKSPHSPPRTISIMNASNVSPDIRSLSVSLADMCSGEISTQLSFEQSNGATVTDHRHTRQVSTVQVLGIHDLRQVKQEVQDLNEKWFDLGLQLGLYHPTLKEIEGTSKSKNDCMTDMLAEWLNQKDDVEKLGGPTWQQLSKTLREMKYKTLSKRVEKHSKHQKI